MKARIVKSDLIRKILDDTSPEEKKEIQDRIDLQCGLQEVYTVLLKESKNLDGEIVDMVNKNFWELLLKIE